MSKAVKKQNEHIALFRERWNTWRAYLEELVEDNGGRLICPQGRQLETKPLVKAGDIEGSIKISLPFPICLYSIPKKLRGKGQEKLTIFIDGTYELEEEPKDHIRRIKSQVAFYEMTPKAQPEFKLLDAYHFDFFDNDHVANHAPHPTFHAQRDIRVSECEPRFDAALRALSGYQGHTYKNHSDKSKLFQLGFFRIPTPQLDILNVGAVVAADQLVGVGSQKCWENFQFLLQSIHGATGEHHHVKNPKNHKAKIYHHPRKQLADWYCSR